MDEIGPDLRDMQSMGSVDQIHPNYLDLEKKISRYAGINPNLLISIIIDTLRYIPMIEQACLFIGFCTLL